MTRRGGVLALGAFLFLISLGSHDLVAPDEPYFAEGAREMVKDGHWWVPHVNGAVTTDKPPLFFWLIALFSLPGGEVTAWTARLPSALAALGTLLLTLRLGARIVGTRAAAMGGIVLVTAYLFWDKARSCQIDSVLCLMILGAVSAFEAWRAGAWPGRRAGLVFWGCCGLAVLAKGPVGVLVPLGIVLVTLVWDRELGRLRRFAPLLGPLLFVAVVGAWILAAETSPADYSVLGALREHFVDRAASGLHHPQPPWYFLEVLPVTLLPWIGLLPGAVVLAWRRRLDPGARLLLSMAVFVLVFFSIPVEKRSLYILPAFPAFALLIGALVASRAPVDDAGHVKFDAMRPDRRWITLPLGLTGVLFVVLGTAVPGLLVFGESLGERLTRGGDVDPSEILRTSETGLAVLLGAVLVLGGLFTLGASALGRVRVAFLLNATTAAVLYVVVAVLVLPAFSSARSARGLAEAVLEHTGEARARGERVAAFATGNLPEALSLYTDGVYFLEIHRPVDLERFLDENAGGWAVVLNARYQSLPPGLRARFEVIETVRVSRKSYLLGRNRIGADPGDPDAPLP